MRRRAIRSSAREIAATQHFTEPPPRYSEASLVKRMEELGIGRPSTYASILAVLRDRDYVRIEKKRLVAGGQGPDRHRLPRELLPPLRRIRLHGRPRGAARPNLEQRDRLEAGAARLLAGLLGRHRRNQGTAHRRGARRAQRAPRPAHLPATRATAPTRAPARSAATGQLSPEARQVRRLRRLLATIRSAATPASSPPPGGRRRRGRGGRRPRRQGARRGPRDRPSTSLYATAASAPTCSSARARSPSAPRLPKG